MEKFSKIRNSLNKVKKVKNVRWLLPGWVFYEYYKLYKEKGNTKRKSFGYGAKAEAMRFAAFASFPIPGTYELTTTGLAVIKRKIEEGEFENFTLRSFKDFTPIKKFKVDKARGTKNKAIYKLVFNKQT